MIDLVHEQMNQSIEKRLISQLVLASDRRYMSIYESWWAGAGLGRRKD